VVSWFQAFAFKRYPGFKPLLSNATLYRYIQAAMAGAVAHLLPGSAPVEVTAHSVMSLAPELFLSCEGVRPVWPSVIRPALDRWGRFAELSADRAALLVAQVGLALLTTLFCK
jgi:hypothetical protein